MGLFELNLLKFSPSIQIFNKNEEPTLGLKHLILKNDEHIEKILEVPFPKFDPKNELHQELSELGKTCQKKSRKIAKEENYSGLAPNQLGRARRDIKDKLGSNFENINKLVEKIINEG